MPITLIPIPILAVATVVIHIFTKNNKQGQIPIFVKISILSCIFLFFSLCWIVQQQFSVLFLIFEVIYRPVLIMLPIWVIIVSKAKFSFQSVLALLMPIIGFLISLVNFGAGNLVLQQLIIFATVCLIVFLSTKNYTPTLKSISKE
jgi:hypothetical protein